MDAKQELEHKLTLEIVLTGTTCGEACWHAREDVCRCSCGGKNHGCLKSEGGERPARTAKIDGEFYTLKSVGLRSFGEDNQFGQLYDEAEAINAAAGDRISYGFAYPWRETDKGAPARIKPASKDQIAKWPELAAYRQIERWQSVYLLWVKGV